MDAANERRRNEKGVVTNEAKRAIVENVVTDLNANVPDPRATAQSKEQVLSPEAALLFDKSVVARPLMIPEVCNIHVKNLEYQYRWVNLDGQHGRVYTQRRAMGFVNATPDDVEILGGDAAVDAGTIRAGDLILMRIRRDLYNAHIKWNMEKAMILQRARGMYLNNTSSDVYSDKVASKESVAQLPHKNLASSFIPGNPDALIDGAAAQGGLEAARAQTEEIRDKIAAERAAVQAKVEE